MTWRMIHVAVVGIGVGTLNNEELDNRMQLLKHRILRNRDRDGGIVELGMRNCRGKLTDIRTQRTTAFGRFSERWKGSGLSRCAISSCERSDGFGKNTYFCRSWSWHLTLSRAVCRTELHRDQNTERRNLSRIDLATKTQRRLYTTALTALVEDSVAYEYYIPPESRF